MMSFKKSLLVLFAVAVAGVHAADEAPAVDNADGVVIPLMDFNLDGDAADEAGRQAKEEIDNDKIMKAQAADDDNRAKVLQAKADKEFGYAAAQARANEVVREKATTDTIGLCVESVTKQEAWFATPATSCPPGWTFTLDPLTQGDVVPKILKNAKANYIKARAKEDKEQKKIKNSAKRSKREADVIKEQEKRLKKVEVIIETGADACHEGPGIVAALEAAEIQTGEHTPDVVDQVSNGAPSNDQCVKVFKAATKGLEKFQDDSSCCCVLWVSFVSASVFAVVVVAAMMCRKSSNSDDDDDL